MNGTLEKIMKFVQTSQSASRKPTNFPISTLADMEKFEDIDDEEYSNAVSDNKNNFLLYTGSFLWIGH